MGDTLTCVICKVDISIGNIDQLPNNVILVGHHAQGFKFKQVREVKRQRIKHIFLVGTGLNEWSSGALAMNCLMKLPLTNSGWQRVK